VSGTQTPDLVASPDACCAPASETDTDTTPSRPGPLRVLLVSTYELGHQPFGLASPAAWLRAAGCEVTCADLAVGALDEAATTAADLVAVYVPMHTATRLASQVIPRIRALNPSAHLCAYGLYAPVNIELLHGLGVSTVLGGEFEEPLVDLVANLLAEREATPAVPAARRELPIISLGRQQFRTPERADLPPLSSYASLRMPDGDSRVVGYTEATRGCKHLCRHCPIVPVYNGRFRVVQNDVVLADIDRQVEAGAQHITFGDPDFLNGPRHAVAIVEALHTRHPTLTYDVIVKVQHLVAHADLLPTLRRTGCLLITSAVESFDELVLDVFDKRHTRADFETAVRLLRETDIAFNPTFVAFTPWTTRATYVDFLATIHHLGLVGNVAPVQYAIRLLVTRGSRLLELPDIDDYVGEFDVDGLCYRWTHPDPLMDTLQERVFEVVEAAVAGDLSRPDVFRQVCERTAEVVGEPLSGRLAALEHHAEAEVVPSMSEPWYCCAEPVRGQLEPLL
jgi:radical SAM superfamily enzyme YgiQ (UPF0313 family)